MSLITRITTRGTRSSRRASTSISTSISKPWARYLSTTDQQHFDVTIVGGGAAGSLMARLLAQKVPSLKVSVLDFRTPKLGKDVLGNGSGSDSGNTSMTEPSARAYALSPSSLDLLGDDIIDRLRQSGRIAFYDSMQVWESDGPATLHFTKEDLDDVNADTNANANVDIDIDANQNELKGVLGAVIEDEPLVSCIWDELRTKDQVHLISPAAVKRIVAPSTSSKSSPSVNHPPVELTYENENKEEKTITTDLLIAADGANSFVRRLVGKFPTMSMGYGRKAVTCTVALHNNIDKIAFQRFQPNGPIALLPVWDNNNNSHNGNRESKNYANIVWSTTPEEAEELQKLSNEEFIQRMNDLLQSGPTNAPPLFSNEMKEKAPWPLADAANGIEMLSQSINTGLSMSSWTERQRGFVTPPVITEVVGRRFGFDLNLMHAKNYVGPRVCLIGDAAHTIHPMAGQGLNLGMGDAECLARHIQRSVQSGMGIKDKAGLQYALQQYESERQREVVSVMGGIQFLHAAFGTTFSPAIHVRSVGMNLINSLGPIRRKLVKVATGSDGIFEKR